MIIKYAIENTNLVKTAPKLAVVLAFGGSNCVPPGRRVDPHVIPAHISLRPNHYFSFLDLKPAQAFLVLPMGSNKQHLKNYRESGI